MRLIVYEREIAATSRRRRINIRKTMARLSKHRFAATNDARNDISTRRRKQRHRWRHRGMWRVAPRQRISSGMVYLAQTAKIAAISPSYRRHGERPLARLCAGVTSRNAAERTSVLDGTSRMACVSDAVMKHRRISSTWRIIRVNSAVRERRHGGGALNNWCK